MICLWTIKNTNSTDDAFIIGDAIYHLSLQYFLFQNSENSFQYRERAKQLLLQWAESNTPTDHTPSESTFLDFIYGYSLIKPKIDVESRVKIDGWLNTRFNYYAGLWVRSNNWETIRNALMLNIGYVLNNRIYVNKAINDFNTHHNKNFRADGSSIDFIGRDGFAYHTYDMFFSAQIARSLYINEGREEVNRFANHRSTNWVNIRFFPNDQPVLGGSFADAVYFMKPYVMDPTNNVHLEFVNTGWSPDTTRGDYNKPYNSSASTYAFVEMASVMRDEMLAFIQKKSPGFNRYSNLIFYLNSYGPQYSRPLEEEVTLFEHTSYRGWYKTLKVGNYSLQNLQTLGVVNNALSSISIPPGIKVTLYDNGDLSGSSIELTKNTVDLIKLSFNDRMSSIKIKRIN